MSPETLKKANELEGRISDLKYYIDTSKCPFIGIEYSIDPEIQKDSHNQYEHLSKTRLGEEATQEICRLVTQILKKQLVQAQADFKAL